MKGTVKWFEKSYGFISGDDGKDYFLHYSNICMAGLKRLDAGDHVEFETEQTEKGTQAVNVQPVLTTRMIKKSLKDEHLHLKKIGNNSYLVIDENNIIQSPEQGMTFEELAAYAGFSVSEE